MRLLSQKRGEGDISARKIIFYIIFGFFLTLTILTIVFIVPKKNAEIAQIPIGLENYLLTQRFLNSPICFAYQDEVTGHIKQKVIDIKKFTQDNLRNCYDARNDDIRAYRFVLEYKNKNIELRTDNFRGYPGEYTTETVFVIDSNNLIQSKLLIETHE